LRTAYFAFLPFDVLAEDDAFRLWRSEHRALAGPADRVRTRFLESPVLLTELPGEISAPQVFIRVDTRGVRLRPEDLERARQEDEPQDLASQRLVYRDPR
jgi:hypothetical protein